MRKNQSDDSTTSEINSGINDNADSAVWTVEDLKMLHLKKEKVTG